MLRKNNVLVVDDEPIWLRTVARLIAPDHTVVLAETVAAARSLLKKQRVAAAIIDIILPDGEGFDLLESVPRGVPVLLLTGCFDAAFVNRAQILGHELAFKTDATNCVRAFLRRVDARPPSPGEIALRLGADHSLTPRESEVLKLSLEEPDLTREEMAARLKISTPTLKTHMKAILAATGDSDMRALRRKCGNRR